MTDRWSFSLSFNPESNQAAAVQNAEECRRRRDDGDGSFDDNLSLYRSK